MNMEKINPGTGQMFVGVPVPAATGQRKPRLALMGEFSAGKSTLANLLAGGQHLPVQVTATQLPPVWLSYGIAPAYRIDLQGKTIPVSLARLEDVPIAETAYIRIFEQSETLALCDIIDMPGISDPNMSANVWQRVLPEADGVIWCTHATQAWRQSESAIWATMTAELQQRSLLLLTRIDKILDERDRQRIVKRVNKETEGLFSGPCLSISLTRSLAATGDPAALAAAGTTAFFDQLTRLVQTISQGLGLLNVQLPAGPDDPNAAQATPIIPRRIRSEMANSALTPRPALGSVDPDIAAFQAMARGGNG